MTTIRFDKAWDNAYRCAEEVAQSGTDVVLVRDLAGRIMLIPDDRGSSEVPVDLADEMAGATGAFAAPQPVLPASELFAPEAVLDSPDLVVQHPRNEKRGRFAILERTVVGSDWVRAEMEPPLKYVTLYGFKGGVGRSTATFMLAKRLAADGYCVLVADLDLESPGVGELLQTPENRSEHGIVDYLVESAVGNEAGLDLVSRSEVVRPAGVGEVWLLPADGRPLPESGTRRDAGPARRDYLAKLNRAYAEVPGPDTTPLTLADRLDSALKAGINQVTEHSREPDVVLLDSRAGIHDIAAIAITRLSGLTLLFASNNPHTWNGYRMLFDQWQQLPPETFEKIRERLRMVAPFVPAGAEEHHLEEFRDSAQTCFAETLYDEEKAGEAPAFNFGRDDEDAPHSPLPILFHSDLVGINHFDRPDWHEHPFVEAAYDQFLNEAVDLIIGGES